MKYQLYLILFLLFSVSACGPIKSTQSIIKADSAKQETLELISRAAEDASIIERDIYHNESLNKKAKGEAAYFYFKGDLYLKKARELQAGALYEDSFKMADKAIEYFATASAMIAAANAQDSEPKPAETPQADKNENQEAEPAVAPVVVPETKPSENKEKLPADQLKENNKTEEKDKKEVPIVPVPVQTKAEPSPQKPEEVKPAPAVPEQKSNPETKPAEKKEEKSEKEVKEKKSEDPYADMYEKYKKMAEEAKKKKAKDAKDEKEEDKK